MTSRIRQAWWGWNPVRLRRILRLTKYQMDNVNNGWGNMHTELLVMKEKCKHLEAEVSRLERLSNG
jgi:hypothetical protein